MKKYVLPFALAAFAASTTASNACRMTLDAGPEDIKYADVVVVGWTENYKIVLDRAIREKNISDQKLPENLRKFDSNKNQSLLPDYARFEVRVLETLKGNPPQHFTATSGIWYPDGQHNTGPGPFVIALRRADTPRRIPGIDRQSPEPDLLDVVQAPCGRPFIMPFASDAARKVREKLQ